MSDQFRIAGNGTITFEIKGYGNSGPKCVSDANWLKAFVTVGSTTLTSTVDAYVTTQDLHRLLQELEQGLSCGSGKAVFAVDEEAVFLEVSFSEGNEFVLSGYLKEMNAPSLITSFEFRVDRGDLARAAEGLSDMLENYPIITEL